MKENTDCATFTEITFHDEVLNSEQPVLAVFEAGWSGTCDIMMPILKNLCLEYKGRVKIGMIDIDNNRELAERYRIVNLPVLVFFSHGEIVDHIAGLVPKREIVTKLDQLMSSNHE